MWYNRWSKGEQNCLVTYEGRLIGKVATFHRGNSAIPRKVDAAPMAKVRNLFVELEMQSIYFLEHTAVQYPRYAGSTRRSSTLPLDHAVLLCTEALTRGITMKAVVSEETAKTREQVVSTASRADDTPVSSDTTTNRFRGTRNNADNCRPFS
jgi:hypothetical protein